MPRPIEKKLSSRGYEDAQSLQISELVQLEQDDCESVDANHFYSSLIIQIPHTGQGVGQFGQKADAIKIQSSQIILHPE